MDLGGITRRHLVGDAPSDLAKVEAVIDEEPRTGGERVLLALIIVLSLVVWAPLFALLITSIL